MVAVIEKAAKSVVYFGILTATLGLSGCDKIKSLIEKDAGCGDPVTLTTVQNEFQKGILSATKQYVELDGGQINLDTVRGIVAEFKPEIDDIRTQDKHACVGTLKLVINPQRLAQADAVRQAQGDTPIKAALFEQDLTLENNTFRQSLDYQLEPTDDGKKVVITLKNSRALQKFLAQLAVDASQPVASDSEDDTVVASVVMAEPVITDTPPIPPKAEPVTNDTADTATDTATDSEPSEPAASATDAQSDAIVLATEQARIRLSIKRKQFNDMWDSASPEAQQSLTDDQKQWVKERDITCQNEADTAKAGYEEIARMQCVTRMLGERYNEVKEYFDNYE